MRLILVEDTLGDILLIRAALKDLTTPVELSVVPHGQAALDFLYRREPYTLASCPAVILLDLHLPQKHGHDVLAELKQHPQFAGIPVVVFTSSTDPREVQRCYELGAKTVLQKPMVLEEYFAAVRTVVEVGGAYV